MVYLQNGQQPPFAATFVAAAAVVPSSASSAATIPRKFVFIMSPFGSAERVIRAPEPPYGFRRT
jgi:hypothetical protein